MGIRCCRQRLATESDEGQIALALHCYLQPTGFAAKDAHAKVQSNGEAPVTQLNTSLGQRRSHLSAVTGGIVETEAKVTGTARRCSVIGELSLIGEGCTQWRLVGRW